MVEKSIFKSMGKFGQIMSRVRDATTNPDMRAWMSLPAEVNVGRLLLSPSVKRLTLVTLDAENRVLARKQLSLRGERNNFIYARTIGKILVVHASKKMWTDD